MNTARLPSGDIDSGARPLPFAAARLPCGAVDAAVESPAAAVHLPVSRLHSKPRFSARTFNWPLGVKLSDWMGSSLALSVLPSAAPSPAASLVRSKAALRDPL